MHIRADSILAEETPRRALERDGRSLSPASAHARPSRGYDRPALYTPTDGHFGGQGTGIDAQAAQRVRRHRVRPQYTLVVGPTATSSMSTRRPLSGRPREAREVKASMRSVTSSLRRKPV